MKNETVTRTQPEIDSEPNSYSTEIIPRLLVCHAPHGNLITDRTAVRAPFVVGRSSKCALTISDSRMSKMHFKISQSSDGYVLEDLNSTNHTWLNGARVQRAQPLPPGSVIRVGDTILYFEQHTHHPVSPAPVHNYGIVGKFYLHKIISQLKEAALSERHVLISGPTGSGKELAARALTEMYASQCTPLKMVSHNTARFSSEEEAASTLFGIAPKAFTSVSARKGLIEQADGGVLFLDEIHNLPIRVQRSLLRVMEDGLFSKIGEDASKRVNVRFILASNEPGTFRGLAPDLYSRCREISLAGLCERRADIPIIFEAVLRRHAENAQLASDAICRQVNSSHIEAMCLDGFSNENVRGIIDLCDRIVTRINNSDNAQQAIDSVFRERFAQSPVFSRKSVSPAMSEKYPPQQSQYERNRSIITVAFQKCSGNFSAMERLLKKSGISCSRRWLKIYADKWQLKI